MYDSRSNYDYRNDRSSVSRNGSKESRNYIKSFLAIDVWNINRNIGAYNLKCFFEEYGKVDGVKMYLNSKGNTISALVVFKPVPEHIYDLFNYPIFYNNSPIYLDYSSEQEYLKIEKRYKNLKFYVLDYIEFGVMMEPESFLNCYKIELATFFIDFEKAKFNLYFEKDDNQYKIIFNFRDIKDYILTYKTDDFHSLLYRLNCPSKIWKKNHLVNYGNSYLFDSNEDWIRVTHFPLNERENTYIIKEPLEMVRDNIIDFGKWNVLKIQLTLSESDWHTFIFKREITELKKHNLVPDPLQYIEFKYFDKEINNNRHIFKDINFSILFLIECLISHDLINEKSICKEFFDLLLSQPVRVSYSILEDIWGNKAKVWSPLNHYLNAIQNEKTHAVEIFIPHYCALIRKIVITPSKVYMVPGIMETSNRVLRQYRNYHEQFLRVVFCDEDLSRVSSYVDENQLIFERIFGILQHGIKIGEQLFEFLAFSGSQLREHGCWFFSDSEKLNKEEIRAWMGDFSNIKTVAKYAARMGQCFSSTRDAAHLSIDNISEIKDIERNGYVFSDGVGKISPNLLYDISSIYDLSFCPSAIQFRLGGFKGVLSYNDELARNQIQLRPSQKKFNSDHTILEVVKMAIFTSCHLNRQIITILSSLGVPDSIFIEMQDEMMKELSNLLIDEKVALRVLSKNSDEFGMTSLIGKLIKSGFMKSKDRFVMDFLNLFNVSLLTDLKNKTRIYVEKGVFLMGVLDETFTLQENQIFVQYASSDDPFKRNIVKGKCLIVRNPCFHPGDIRMVEAVDIKKLHSHYDVVVFPSDGERDLANQCSGGDLDGDDFT